MRWRPVIEQQPTEGNPARGKILALMDKLNLSEIAALESSRDPLVWPRGSKTHYRDPVEKMYVEAKALGGWTSTAGSDPLLEDWNLTREPTRMLLEIAEEFGKRVSELKSDRGLGGFHGIA